MLRHCTSSRCWNWCLDCRTAARMRCWAHAPPPLEAAGAAAHTALTFAFRFWRLSHLVLSLSLCVRHFRHTHS